MGLIQERLDIKLLILFILRRLPGEVDPDTLCELCLFERDLNYFEYKDCLEELVETKHISKTDTGYTITEKGSKNAEMVESSLPYSTRSKALKLLEPEKKRLEREAMMTAKHSVKDGECIVELGMSDGKGEIIHMKLLCADEKQAGKMEAYFKKNAEIIYQDIILMLSK